MFEKYMKWLEQKLKQSVNKALSVLDNSIEQKSPLDTGEYMKWNKRSNAKRDGSKIVWEVYNDSSYWYQVEYWFRSSPVNRHKNRRSWWTVIYRGVGARVYTRTKDEKEQEIKTILSNAIKWTP